MNGSDFLRSTKSGLHFVEELQAFRRGLLRQRLRWNSLRPTQAEKS